VPPTAIQAVEHRPPAADRAKDNSLRHVADVIEKNNGHPALDQMKGFTFPVVTMHTVVGIPAEGNNHLLHQILVRLVEAQAGTTEGGVCGRGFQLGQLVRLNFDDFLTWEEEGRHQAATFLQKPRMHPAT
jgi:hypothetical protein